MQSKSLASIYSGKQFNRWIDAVCQRGQKRVQSPKSKVQRKEDPGLRLDDSGSRSSFLNSQFSILILQTPRPQTLDP